MNRFEKGMDSSEKEALDSIVHDTMSGLASDINNAGIETQLKFLFENGWSATDLDIEIDSMVIEE